MEHLVILDYATGEVDIYPVDSEITSGSEDLLASLGHRASDCHYMFTSGNVTFHNETIK